MTEDLFPPFQEELQRSASERTAQAMGSQVLAGIQLQAANDILAQRLDVLSAKFNEASAQLQAMETDLADLRAQVDAARTPAVAGKPDDNIDPYIGRALDRARDTDASFGIPRDVTGNPIPDLS